VTPDQWAKVNDLFHAAIEQTPDARGAWLTAAAGDDPDVIREVHALIAAHEGEPDFLEGGARASAPTIAAPSLVGRRIGAYQITREIGRGGVGVIYLAHDTRLGRDVAIKALPHDMPFDTRRRERLRREARAAAALAHPNIATVYALEEDGDELFLVTEYVRGQTLRDELAAGPLPPARLVETAIEITRAIGAAHTEGIIHRDLKPDNVMRTTTGSIKILDFGLARAIVSWADEDLGPTLTRSGMLLGTPAYMAPEQIRGGPVDARADLFSTGVMLYELASGVHPFDGHAIGLTLHRILTEMPEPLASRGILTPPGFWTVVERCLQKEPDTRYADSQALLQDLLQVQSTLPTVSTAPIGGGAVGNAAIGSAANGGPTIGSPAIASPPAIATHPAPATTPRPTPFSQAEAEMTTASSEWWWRFHQLAVSLFFTALLVPAWRAWEWLSAVMSPTPLRVWTLVMVTLGVSLRLHLWFLSRYDPPGLREQRARAAFWVRGADAGVSLALLAGGLMIMPAHPGPGAVFLGLGICYAVVFLMIEPATTRAAFRER
jgi:serine/threonine protein kinase